MIWYRVFIGSIICCSLILEGNQAKIINKRGVMDNLNDGLKVAGQMFGINTAADVANLVAKAFSKSNINKNKPDLLSLIQKGLQFSPLQSTSSEDGKSFAYSDTKENLQQHTEGTIKSASALPSKEVVGVNSNTPNFITSILRMVGFDAAKLGALAINALIMIASAIGNTIMGTKHRPVITAVDGGRFYNRSPTPTSATSVSDNYTGDNAETGPEEKFEPNDHQPRSAVDPTSIDWYLQNSSGKMKRILKDATHTNLAEKLTDMIASYETKQGQGSCLKMLVCKSSPFIWGMQKSIRKHIEPHIGKEGDNIDEEIKQETDDLSAEKPLFNTQNFFVHLPSIEEYHEYSEKCEKLYSIHCNTTDLSTKNF